MIAFPFKSEDHMCEVFNKQLEALVIYKQVNLVESFKWWYVPNGQRAGGNALAKNICGHLRRMDAIAYVKKQLQVFAAIMGARDKRLGAKRGVFDYTFHWTDKHGVKCSGFIEMKMPNGALSPEQEDFKEWCIREKRPYAVCTGPTEALKVLQEWGLIKSSAIL